MLQIDTDCENCGDGYTSIEDRWCISCQIDNLKKNFANWTSGNEMIDDFIQNRQQEIYEPDNIIFEWIPYNQLNDIKEINKNNFTAIYSAIWENGPLYYCFHKKEYVRKFGNQKVILECLYNSQNINEFSDKV